MQAILLLVLFYFLHMTDIKKNNVWQIESIDRQSMIDKIYEKIADKTLSFWCIIFHKKNVDCEYDRYWKRTWDDTAWNTRNLYVDEIIWHPISLARVLSALIWIVWIHWSIIVKYDINWWWRDICPRKLLTDSWNDAILDDQSDETIRAILWLLSE